MARRNVRIKKYIDEDTGEVVPFLVIDIQAKDRDFLKVRQALTKTVVERLNYLDGAVKLLFLIMDMAIEAKIFNRPVDIYLTPEFAMEKIGISRATFYNHIRLLLKHKILFRLRPNLYRLNPEMIWIGTLKSYIAWLREKQQMKLFETQEEAA